MSLTLDKIRAGRQDLQTSYDEKGKATREGIPKTLELWFDKYGKAEYPNIGDRDIKAENAASQQFFDEVGKYPTEPHEIDLVSRIAYDEPPADLLTGKDLPQMKLQKYGAFNKAFGEGGAVAGAQEAGRTSQSRLDILQDAIKTKTGAVGAGIGKSKVFEEAGLSGMGALTQSLNARRAEIGNSYERFRRTISDMATIVGEGNQKLFNEADMAVKKYEEIKNEYDTTVERVQSLEDEERQYKKDLQLYSDKMAIEYKYSQMKAGAKKVETVPWSIEAGKLGIAGMPIDQATALLGSPIPTDEFIKAETKNLKESNAYKLQDSWDSLRKDMDKKVESLGKKTTLEKEQKIYSWLGDPDTITEFSFSEMIDQIKAQDIDPSKIFVNYTTFELELISSWEQRLKDNPQTYITNGESEPGKERVIYVIDEKGKRKEIFTYNIPANILSELKKE